MCPICLCGEQKFQTAKLPPFEKNNMRTALLNDIFHEIVVLIRSVRCAHAFFTGHKAAQSAQSFGRLATYQFL